MTNVIAIFDIGKTNKKLFLFDEQYKIVWEQSDACDQIIDEDGEPCEDIQQLTDWAHRSLARITALTDVHIKAINVAAYGASLVYIDRDGKPIAPLYSYLKAYPKLLRDKFYDTYGGETTFSMLTASPVLESLNSGMQLYRVKEQQPGLFSNISSALHLPQYFSFLLTGQACSDITSIGCHTNLWNFPQNHYHEWVYREGVIDKLAPILPSTAVLPVKGMGVGVGIPISGIGLHDSSAAMIPYQESFHEPFVLISTGTWCISMNPFNNAPLTEAELKKDCLCYMSYQGRPIKASRLFAGHEHEQQVQRLAAHFQVSPALAASVVFDADCIALLRERDRAGRATTTPVTGPAFQHRDLSAFPTFEVAYHQLMLDIMHQQVESTRLVLHDTDTHRIFVDGGFGRNQVYMHLLARAFPDTEVFTASIPQATAMGAALAIHQHWNNAPLPGDIIELKYYG